MRMMMKSVSVVAVVMLLMSATSAMADTVTARFDSVNPYRDFSYVLNGHSGTTRAGVFNWTKISGSSDIQDSFTTFCIEITQHVNYGGTYTYDLVDVDNAPNTMPMGGTKADYISELWGRYESTLNTGSSSDIRTKAAAFQIAVWEIVYDDDLDVKSWSSDFRASGSSYWSSWTTMAQDWLDSLTLDSSYMVSGLIALTNPFKQDQITMGPPTTTTVPLPAGVWMGMSLLGGLGLAKRIRGSKA